MNDDFYQYYVKKAEEETKIGGGTPASQRGIVFAILALAESVRMAVQQIAEYK